MSDDKLKTLAKLVSDEMKRTQDAAAVRDRALQSFNYKALLKTYEEADLMAVIEGAIDMAVSGMEKDFAAGADRDALYFAVREILMRWRRRDFVMHEGVEEMVKYINSIIMWREPMVYESVLKKMTRAQYENRIREIITEVYGDVESRKRRGLATNHDEQCLADSDKSA